MKFIPIYTGLNGATPNFACPRCLISKNVKDISKPKDFYNNEKKHWSLHTIVLRGGKNDFGCKSKPLIEIEPEKDCTRRTLFVFKNLRHTSWKTLLKTAGNKIVNLKYRRTGRSGLKNLEKKKNQ